MAGFLCTKVSLFGPWTQVVWRRNCTWMQIRLGCQGEGSFIPSVGLSVSQDGPHCYCLNRGQR
ncbi:hypothetical protein GBAR_LOCUS17002 [Geodia barretti]|uniref:Uncharacterized protein n=1 Tax=Geodia barretti TaxID=519541 RepID=A0AA35WX82_GEOBA|nr:hypothetical protein GBAR_LOCUS17002 [Geodia barretti]